MFTGEFSLEDKHCHFGVYLNGPTQKHGDERVPAKVFGIGGIPLGKDELNKFTGNPHAWDMLYVDKPGKPAEDFWQDIIGDMPLAVGRFKNSCVTIKFGMKPHEVTFDDCTVKSCKIKRTTGGVTMLSFTVVGLKSNISGDLAKLDEFLDTSGTMSVAFGDPEGDDEEDDEKDQEELDLDHQKATAAGAKVKTEKVDTSKRKRKNSSGQTLNA